MYRAYRVWVWRVEDDAHDWVQQICSQTDLYLGKDSALCLSSQLVKGSLAQSGPQLAGQSRRWPVFDFGLRRGGNFIS